MTNLLKNSAVIDFIERVGSTAVLAAGAVYIAAPHVGTGKPALYAGAFSAVKYVLKAVAVWQAKHPDAIATQVENEAEPFVGIPDDENTARLAVTSNS